MRVSKVLITMAIAVLALGMTYAFHDGGVADCVGCHQMHDAPGSTLLVGLDQSSTCLSCHDDSGLTGPSSYHISTSSTVAGEPPLQMTPGGDFGWIKKTYSYQPWGGAPLTFEFGETHGHNIEAVSYGYVAETGAAPGGNVFNAADLTCVSCHDPHGKYRWNADNSVGTFGAPIIGSGSYDTSGLPGDVPGTALGVYRLLGGAGFDASETFTFSADPPVAFAPSTYNRSEDTKMTRVAYGDGMSAWCGQCHPAMHDSQAGPLYHPTDAVLNGAIPTDDIYNNYRGSGTYGDPSNLADSTTAFLSLVPFEEGKGYGDALALQDNASPHRLPGFPPTFGDTVLDGPDATLSQVMCLSCHRAHASGWEYAMRWNNEVSFISADSEWAGTDHPDTSGTEIGLDEARGRTVLEATAAYYNIPASGITDTGAQFATFQRSLCNKCHAQD